MSINERTKQLKDQELKKKYGAAMTQKEFDRVQNTMIKDKSGAAITGPEADKVKENMLKQISGAAVSENEMERLKNIKGNKKGGMTKGQKKIRTVMKEFKSNKLKSSSGQKVTNPKQAIAIALSEAGQSNKPKKAAMGAFIVKGGDYIKDLL